MNVGIRKSRDRMKVEVIRVQGPVGQKGVGGLKSKKYIFYYIRTKIFQGWWW